MEDTASSLLHRLKDQSDSAAWVRLNDLYRPWLLGWLIRQGVNEVDAEDLVQDILVVVHRELAGFQHNQRVGAFRAWLRTIAVNRLHAEFRGRRYRPVASGDGALADHLQQLADPGSALSKQWDIDHDRHVLGRLLALIEHDFAPATWQAFRGVMMDGEKPAAVAARLAVSVNAVLLAKSRVLARLRQEACGLVDEG